LRRWSRTLKERSADSMMKRKSVDISRSVFFHWVGRNRALRRLLAQIAFADQDDAEFKSENI
jgi:hypothetical protein